MYLGVALDRTLSYKEHLTKTAAKLKSRNNLLSKLAGSSWGAGASTLRTSAMALCYSVAEYCSPVWCQSAHISQVDTQLNSTMRLVSGTLRPTQLPWLPVLSNIAPPALRRKEATDRLIANASQHTDWGLHKDIHDHPTQRLQSRHPLWTDMAPSDLATNWREEWKAASVVNKSLVDDPTIRQPGFDLQRRHWSALNRFRTGQGPCRANLKKWGLTTDDHCRCGSTQTMDHIISSCPLTKLDGGLDTLHSADQAATDWLKTVASTAFAK